MEDNKTKEVVSAEQYRKDSLTGKLYDSTYFDVTDTIDIMLEEYAVMRVEQSTKQLQDAAKELVQLLNRLDNQRWFAALVEKDLTLANEVSDKLSKLEKLLNTKS